MASLDNPGDIAINTSAVIAALPVVGMRMLFRTLAGARDDAAAAEPRDDAAFSRRLWQPPAQAACDKNQPDTNTAAAALVDGPASATAHAASSCGSPRGSLPGDSSAAAGTSSDESDCEKEAEAPLDRLTFLALHGLELFQRTKIIGSGAYGVVSEGTVRLPDGTLYRCARKTFKSTKEQPARPALRAEVAALQRVQGCPGAVQLLAHSVSPRCCLLMELAELGTLQDELDLAEQYFNDTRMLLPEYSIRQIATAVLEVFVVLHSKGVGYFDCKPENVLLKEDRVMMGDFGTCSGRSRATGHYPITGTFGCLAPEVAAAFDDPALAHRITPAADMYSLGLLLATCAAYHGRPGKMVRLQQGSPLPSYVPASLRSLIEALLADDPAKRPSPHLALQHAFFTGAAAD